MRPSDIKQISPDGRLGINKKLAMMNLDIKLSTPVNKKKPI